MYKWFLAWRYLHTKLIALFGVASVMLCVAMVLVVLSVMGGFLDMVRAHSRGLHAEIVVDNASMQGFPFYDEFANYVEKDLPDVVRVTSPVIWTYGIFRVPKTSFTKPARVTGIRLDDYVQLNDFAKGLHYDSYFPGTTSLRPQQMPVVGFDEARGLVFPDEHQQALREWYNSEPDPDRIAEFEAFPFEKVPFPGIASEYAATRLFAVDIGPPRYDGPTLDGVIVGADVLHYRRADGRFDRRIVRGADVAVILMPLSPAGNPTGEPPVRWPMRYVDDCRTGIYEIDSLNVYVDVNVLQHKLAMDPQPLVDGGMTRSRANQLLIGLREGVDLEEAKAVIGAAWRRFYVDVLQREELTPQEADALKFVDVYTWEDLQRAFIQAVEKEKVLVTILFAVISMVAIVLVGCIFYMIVEKKTRDVGILKAIGASSRGVGGMFIVYAAAVGIVGSLLGLLIGSLFVWNINDIQDFLASLHPQLRVWTPDVYSFDRIPEVVKRADAIWVAAIAVVSSMVGSLIPAWIAARVWPVEALRYE